MTGAGASIAIVAISRRGSGLARVLATALGGTTTLYLERRLLEDSDHAVAFDIGLVQFAQQVRGGRGMRTELAGFGLHLSGCPHDRVAQVGGFSRRIAEFTVDAFAAIDDGGQSRRHLFRILQLIPGLSDALARGSNVHQRSARVMHQRLDLSGRGKRFA